ncbi:MAG: tyrosine--tRNA ligase [Candidatus Harrisonbacteria bacterium CG10_big_fil_rev_8_21_14_0_10_44_23]|uniref:Tyrosine--tRNA ligase n=1 Tax=Candidatus Harrisonbacteria bacterium CG10_big_fil_rev_8_21_14_0_10_44_23 TaxID=1974585 RepID=A0A2H0UQU4_9BACT|nr:MAG: tyrosine--tRNA ligase [Candidatus Harrisonbacteria bacterium CG10_big_fil_rev_8_21_14_0_10_44_23]
MQISTDKRKIDQILSRGVEDVIEKESLKAKLESGKQLRVKLGFDPTGPNIHIGRAIVLRKLRAFQDLGHKVIFIVGDFTAQIGDPSDKLEKRPMLTAKQVKENIKTYKEQVGKIIDLRKAEFRFNSKWLKKLKLAELMQLQESFTVGQMLARRNFKERFEKGQEISTREFSYPLMQGYDSVKVAADVELGGFDQLFNLTAGRTIQQHYKQKPQDVLTTQMLEGTDGRKMSTSWGNVINIVDNPNDMFGKIMSLKDELIEKYFLLCTNLRDGEIKEISRDNNPKDQKMRLAFEIVEIYHGKDEAGKAKKEFENIFSGGGKPEEIQEVKVSEEKMNLIDLLLMASLASSKSEARRLIEQGGVRINDEKRTDPKGNVEITSGMIVQVGPRRFAKIVRN